MCSLPLASGFGTSIILSNRPGRNKASSTISNLFVAPIIITLCSSSNPSISVKICETTFSVTCELELPAPRFGTRESTSSKKKPLDKKIDIKKIIELTDGFSGADIAAVANQAAIMALKRYVNSQSKEVKDIKISQNDLEEAVSKVGPPIKKEKAPPEFG